MFLSFSCHGGTGSVRIKQDQVIELCRRPEAARSSRGLEAAFRVAVRKYPITDFKFEMKPCI
jgi:hypothetical protein